MRGTLFPAARSASALGPGGTLSPAARSATPRPLPLPASPGSLRERRAPRAPVTLSEANCGGTAREGQGGRARPPRTNLTATEPARHPAPRAPVTLSEANTRGTAPKGRGGRDAPQEQSHDGNVRPAAGAGTPRPRRQRRREFFLVLAARFFAEHSHALLASGCDARSRTPRGVRVGAASRPPHPQRRTLTLDIASG
jgi:hypothetical protein